MVCIEQDRRLLHHAKSLPTSFLICDIRVIFVEKLQELLEDRYVNFDKLNNIDELHMY